MSPDRLFVNAAQVVTCRGPARARRGAELRDLAILSDHAVLVRGGEIGMVGPTDDLERACPSAEIEDCSGRVLMPGLVDSHTHAIFGKPRHEEQEMRAAGADYMAIAASGGGIHSSVRDLRTRGDDELVALALPRLERLAAHGSTTIEVKSGYGLSVHDELRVLRVIQRLSAMTTLRLVPTFLGAHEIPMEARARPTGREEYVRSIIDEMIPRVASEGLARCIDVFCEPGAFTVSESRQILLAGKRAGLAPKLHADELAPSGGAELAAELEALSADHLGAVSEAGIRALAASQTVATLLPGTLLFLGKPKQAPARALVDAGAAIAIASDFNPGTSPTPNFPLILTLAVSQLRLSVSEALLAATVNGAAALGLAEKVGQITPGFSADLALFDIEDVRELPYWYGDHRCRRSWVGGRPLVS